MRTSFQDIATRAANAEANFIETLVEIAGISEAEAAKVMALYLKEKIAKIDHNIGRISVKHGVFLEADVIHNTVAA